MKTRWFLLLVCSAGMLAILHRDAIRPIYHPRFINAAAARLDDDALVR